MSAVLCEVDLTTAYGRGLDACWSGLMAGRRAFSEIARFDTAHFRASHAGIVDGLDATRNESLCMQMLSPLLDKIRPRVPSGTQVILASTVGEIDLLERAILTNTAVGDSSSLSMLLQRIEQHLGTAGDGLVVSAACASSTAALAHAASLVTAGTRDSVLVVCCDCVSEFVFAGFSSLMALSEEPARPFDAQRSGLSIGEAAACALVVDEDLAASAGRTPLARVVGWGLSNDANHMTGPSRDGRGLADAIAAALSRAAVAPGDVSSVCAHGTGTLYNDGMEMKALRLVFGDSPCPTYGVKGTLGHTMGAAGLVEVAIAAKALHERTAPPTVGCETPDPSAEGWVSCLPRPTGSGPALSTNSGFGGINAAIVLGACEPAAECADDDTGERAP